MDRSSRVRGREVHTPQATPLRAGQAEASAEEATPDSEPASYPTAVPVTRVTMRVSATISGNGTDGLRRTGVIGVNVVDVRRVADYLLGREEEAENSLTLARKTDPSNTEFPYALGRIYYQEHRYADAIREFQAALVLDPKSYKAYDNLGLCYEAVGDGRQALAAYTRALELVYNDHPDYDWVYANFAEMMMKRGDYEQAFQLAAEAAARNPQSARDCYLTGKALAKLSKWDLSARWLKRAAELDPNYAEPHYLLAQAYRQEGNEAGAVP